ncbi:uncharacterized protein LOC130771627 [Actinidia eriantha]|uniref:uncharacterized protein LOC130771627 n=1 Tax=Actinidia eriantha TaxID=165200 RepID=UPI00258EAA4C|nr:uncharacterized protein LOC130771627 [Actinidia eriantha]
MATKFDMKWQLNFPVIVAMKGRPFTGKSTIARQIGKAFPCPVIDHDDIRSSLAHLQLFLPPSISPQRDQQMDDLSFQDVCRVAQTQLQLFKIVVVDSSLSPRSRLDHLVEISNSNGAVLVILECKPIVQATRRKWWLEHERDYDVTRQSNYPYKPSTWDDVKDLSGKYSDYDDKDVRKLIADTTSEMVDLQLTFPLLELAKSEGICHLHVKQWTDQKMGNLSLETQAVAEPRHSSRNHIIRFSVDKRIPENEEAHINCNKCLESISSSVEAYNCTHCNLYLHKSCAESHPIKKLELSPQDRPPFLHPTRYEYLFPETHQCDACREENKDFSYDCEGCLFHTHLKCDLLPTVLNCHQGHEHPLNFAISSLSDVFDFTCQACGNPGKHFVYICRICSFGYHVNCAFLPSIVNHRKHIHSLSLAFFTPEDDSDEFYCDTCETERNPKLWFYKCLDCSYTSHLTCIVPK